jgi:chromosome segregation ATPase
VAGWLRIKQAPATGQTVAVDSTTFQELVRKSTEWDKAVAAGYASWNDVAAALTSKQTTIDHLNATVADKNNTISTLQSTNTALTAQVATLQDQLNTATEQAKKVPDLIEQLSTASFNLVQARQNNDTAQRSIAQLKSQLAAAKPTTFADKLKFLFS